MIYLDHAASAPLRKEALQAMLPYLTKDYGNPSAIYRAGREAKSAISNARRKIAETLSLYPDEIYFTSGGTEADNWALVAAFEAAKAAGQRPRFITSSVEHHAILETLAYLKEERDAAVTFLPVDSKGIVNPETLSAALKEDCCLVSIMTANNEVGSLQPIEALAEIAHQKNVPFHTDAVQAYGHMQMKTVASSVDLLSASAHKFGGPKGSGFLVIKRGLPMRAFLRGGAQERKRRAGTENVAGIVGMGIAAELANLEMDENCAREKKRRDLLYEYLRDAIPDVILNGSLEQRLVNNLNLCFPGVSAETLLILMDQKDIALSAGAACAAGGLLPSHVLSAMGLSREASASAVRITVGAENTEEEILTAAKELALAVKRLREIRTR